MIISNTMSHFHAETDWHYVLTYPARVLLEFIFYLFDIHFVLSGGGVETILIGVLSCGLYARFFMIVVAKLKQIFGIRG